MSGETARAAQVGPMMGRARDGVETPGLCVPPRDRLFRSAAKSSSMA